ncbi:hypothetical protein AAMO2058_001386900 [Amorphochlora amoebiformis]
MPGCGQSKSKDCINEGRPLKTRSEYNLIKGGPCDITLGVIQHFLGCLLEISQTVFWRYLKLSFGDISNCLLEISQTVFWRYLKLFWGYLKLFWSYLKLFWRYLKLFWRYLKLFWRYLMLF